VGISRDIRAFASFIYIRQAGSLELNLDFLASETQLHRDYSRHYRGAAESCSFPRFTVSEASGFDTQREDTNQYLEAYLLI
jgi:hypothetical protein